MELIAEYRMLIIAVIGFAVWLARLEAGKHANSSEIRRFWKQRAEDIAGAKELRAIDLTAAKENRSEDQAAAKESRDRTERALEDIGRDIKTLLKVR